MSHPSGNIVTDHKFNPENKMKLKSKSRKPLMISFTRDTNDLRRLGMVAWGGNCIDPAGIRLRDLATRLGSEKPWVETLYQIVARQQPSQLILIDPDFNAFMGDSRDNETQFRNWLKEQQICLNIVSTWSKNKDKNGSPRDVAA
jgi:hypothetical protein